MSGFHKATDKISWPCASFPSPYLSFHFCYNDVGWALPICQVPRCTAHSKRLSFPWEPPRPIIKWSSQGQQGTESKELPSSSQRQWTTDFGIKSGSCGPWVYVLTHFILDVHEGNIIIQRIASSVLLYTIYKPHLVIKSEHALALQAWLSVLCSVPQRSTWTRPWDLTAFPVGIMKND